MEPRGGGAVKRGYFGPGRATLAHKRKKKKEEEDLSSNFEKSLKLTQFLIWDNLLCYIMLYVFVIKTKHPALQDLFFTFKHGDHKKEKVAKL